MKTFLQKNVKLIPATIALLIYMILGVFIYFSVFAEDFIKVEQVVEEDTNKEDETRPASTELIVESGINSISYSARLTNKDRVLSLLDHHYKESGLRFTKLEYTHGIEIDNVNGIKASEGYKWYVYDGEENITNVIDEVNLENRKVYTIKLESIHSEELQ